VSSSATGTTLPALVVGQDGEITVPFARRLLVAGKTPAKIEHLIVESLKGKSVDPQVVVTISNSVENSVSIGGEVAKGARVPLGLEGERLLDAIASAGGVRIPVNESMVRLTRGNRTESVSYSTILEYPDENIYLRPGDVLTVERQPRTFTAFGALGRNFQIAFDADSVSVEEAIAKAGGLQDQRADPAGIFVMRYEEPEFVRKLMPARVLSDDHAAVPVIYHLDMSDAGAYFLARDFRIRDKDIVYAANARLNEVQKFLVLLGSVLAPAATTAAVGAAVR
jgi:polysaccharide export outer membrane protein